MNIRTVNSRALLLDPLEQFEVFNYKCIYFTNLHYSALLVCFLICFLLIYSRDYYRYDNKPNLLLVRDKTFRFIANLIKDNLNDKLVLFFPILYLTFFFLLLSNLVGLIPYSLTVTSSAAVAFFFAITFFIGVLATGYAAHSDTLFQILLPAGVPLCIVPFLIIVELASYLVRVVSLATRLFSNALSGHALVKIMGSFV